MRRARQSGFTLMEVAVATGLMALVMLTLFLGLRLASNAWRRGEQKLNERMSAMAGLDAMERQVSAAVPRAVIRMEDRQPVRYVIFSGTATEMRLLTRASWSAERSRPLWLTTWRVEPAADDDRARQLTVTEYGITDENSMIEALLRDPRFHLYGDAEAQAESVGDRAESIRFAYLEPSTPQSPARWVSQWSPREHDELPRGVRLEFTRGGHTEVSTFLVPLTRSEAR